MDASDDNILSVWLHKSMNETTTKKTNKYRRKIFVYLRGEDVDWILGISTNNPQHHIGIFILSFIEKYITP